MAPSETRDANTSRASRNPEFKLNGRLADIQIAPLQDKRSYCVIPSRILKDKTIRPTQIKVLAAFASYCNPAGVTWVGLKRIGQDLGISGQAVHKHLTILKHRGYIEEISKAYAREKAATRRIIFDPTISAEDAISLNSSREDCRPPEQVRKEEKEMARRRKETKETLPVVPQSQPPEVEQPARINLDEGIRLAFERVVNVDENAVRWLGMALELGATRGMLEACSREGDPVGSVKVLVTRLDKACR